MQYFFVEVAMSEMKAEQQINLRDGKVLTVSGVYSVLAFDENYLKLDTTIGIVYAEGKNLLIENLSKDRREILVIGEIGLVEIKSKAKKK